MSENNEAVTVTANALVESGRTSAARRQAEKLPVRHRWRQVPVAKRVAVASPPGFRASTGR